MPCYKDEKTGTWYCQFRYADFTGKRKQKRKRGFKTKREAQEWEREFHLQKAKSCDMTLASFVELYFNDREHHVRDTTMDTKRNVFDTKIVPLLGNRKMNEITALDIRDWQQRVKEMGEATGLPYSETYLYTIHAQLTALFNYAQTFYGLRFNPCDAAGYMGSSVAGEMLIITKDQYELLRKEFRNEACIELGYSVVLVARRIGDTVPVVMRTYAHLYPNKQQELVSKLEAIGSPSSNDDESDLMSLG